MMVVPSAAAGDAQAYLYNGVKLPALPEWDDVTYPNVTIGEVVDGYLLWATDYAQTVDSSGLNCGSGLGLCYGGIKFLYTDGKWELTTVVYKMSKLIWTNHDIYYDSRSGDDLSGILFLPESEPVPVIDDPLIYDDIPADNGPPVVEAVPDSESIIEVLNSILEYDVATWNLLAYGTNRIRYIERYVADIREALLKFVPSEQETTLKEATSDVTAAYTETFWSDSGGGFGRSDIEDTGFILQNSKDMFDTGLSVSDFFSLFGTYGWGNWFSAETRDDLDTVPKPAVIDDGEDSELSTYEKNLQEIQSFVGGG